MDLLKRTQELEKQKNLLYDIFSGLLMGLSIAEMLVGIHTVGRSMASR